MTSDEGSDNEILSVAALPSLNHADAMDNDQITNHSEDNIFSVLAQELQHDLSLPAGLHDSVSPLDIITFVSGPDTHTCLKAGAAEETLSCPNTAAKSSTEFHAICKRGGWFSCAACTILPQVSRNPDLRKLEETGSKEPQNYTKVYAPGTQVPGTGLEDAPEAKSV